MQIFISVWRRHTRVIAKTLLTAIRTSVQHPPRLSVAHEKADDCEPSGLETNLWVSRGLVLRGQALHCDACLPLEQASLQTHVLAPRCDACLHL